MSAGNDRRKESAARRRWEESRRCIADAIDRDGDFMDIGCANGLLLETLIAWAAERGHQIRPHGIDFIPELVDLARRRHPGAPPDGFEVANAFYWMPKRRYDWVRTELVYVLPADRAAFARHIYDLALAPGGRLIAWHYRGRQDSPIDQAPSLGSLGFEVNGSRSRARKAARIRRG
jgi:2-polyprenyl-3-methyl-5-hydroxy-6-metoxy-1,4-benzoquinol methylase